MSVTRVTAALVLLVVSGCATPPKVHQFDRSVLLSGASFDATWNQIIDVFGERNWPISNMEKASGFINTDWMRVPNSTRYMDCGSPGMNIDTNPQGRFNIVVREDGGTRVTINTLWRTTRGMGQTQWLEDCTSTGVLEGQIHSELRTRLVR
jgi:hypothetical protein